MLWVQQHITSGFLRPNWRTQHVLKLCSNSSQLNKCQVFTSSLNIPGAKRCLFIFEVSSIYYQSAATAQKNVTFYIYSYINMYIATDGAETIFIHSSILYFKIAKTNAQQSLPPIPYSQRLAVVPTWNHKSLCKVMLCHLPSLYAVKSFSAPQIK